MSFQSTTLNVNTDVSVCTPEHDPREITEKNPEKIVSTTTTTTTTNTTPPAVTDGTFDCCVCQELMIKPISIGCGHSMCVSCFEQLTHFDIKSMTSSVSRNDNNNNNNNNRFYQVKCPLCKCINKAHFFQPNIALDSVIESKYPQEHKTRLSLYDMEVKQRQQTKIYKASLRYRQLRQRVQLFIKEGVGFDWDYPNHLMDLVEYFVKRNESWLTETVADHQHVSHIELEVSYHLKDELISYNDNNREWMISGPFVMYQDMTTSFLERYKNNLEDISLEDSMNLVYQMIVKHVGWDSELSVLFSKHTQRLRDQSKQTQSTNNVNTTTNTNTTNTTSFITSSLFTPNLFCKFVSEILQLFISKNKDVSFTNRQVIQQQKLQQQQRRNQHIQMARRLPYPYITDNNTTSTNTSLDLLSSLNNTRAASDGTASANLSNYQSGDVDVIYSDETNRGGEFVSMQTQPQQQRQQIPHYITFDFDPSSSLNSSLSSSSSSSDEDAQLVLRNRLNRSNAVTIPIINYNDDADDIDTTESSDYLE